MTGHAHCKAGSSRRLVRLALLSALIAAPVLLGLTKPAGASVAPTGPDAQSDYAYLDGGLHGATAILNVLDNDYLGIDRATVDTVDLSYDPYNYSDPHLTLDTTGDVSVAEGTPSGDYYLYYQICDKSDSSSCSSSRAEVEVGYNQIDAEDDSGYVSSGRDGGWAVNVLDNDTFDNNTATPDSVYIYDDGGDSALRLDTSTGDVSVEPGTPSDDYYRDYEICDKTDPGNCADAEFDVYVDSADIAADGDYASIGGGLHGATNVLNVLDNDTYNGSPATLSDVYLEEDSSTPELDLDTSTGEISVEPNTPSGFYYVDYEICDTIDTWNCASAEAEVDVGYNQIDAVNDSAFVDVNTLSTDQVAIPNVLANDTFDNAPATLADVNFDYYEADSGLEFDPATGNVSVDAGTPSGDYYVEYEICDNTDDSNCSGTWADVEVGPTEVHANADSGLVASGETGGLVQKAGGGDLNVLDNDTVDRGPATTSNATLSQTLADAGLFLNADGTVSVAPQTPYGDRELDYKICSTIDPDTCDFGSVEVSVGGTEIVAHDDAGSVNQAGGVAVANVLANDRYAGSAATLDSVTLADAGEEAGLSLDTATGSVSADRGMHVGNYSLDYKVCSKVQTWNCAYGEVDVTVVNEAPTATDDTATTDAGTPVTIDVLANDSDPDGDTLAITSASPAAGHGTVSCTASNCTYTPTAGYLGPDSFDYEISDGNGHSATATVSVTVIQPNRPPTATDDTATTDAGTPVTIDVLANDSDPDGDTLAITSASPAAGHGTVSCTASNCTYTPTAGYLGPDSFDYEISDGHGHSATATVTVTVNAGPSGKSSSSPTAPATHKTTKTKLSIENITLHRGVSRTKVRPGGRFRYVITVKNTGSIAARGLVITIARSEKLIYLEAPNANSTRNSLWWTIGRLGADKSRTFLVKVLASATAKPGVIRITATVSAKNGVKRVRSLATVRVLRRLP